MYGAATQLTGRQLGYVFIVLVALDWVASSYIVQNLERDAVQPFVITSICNSLLLLFLFAHWFHKWLRVSTSPLVFHYLGGLKRSLGAPPPGQVTDAQLLRTAAFVAPLWFLGQLAFNASLRDTDVTSNTILSSTGSLWTFLAAVALRQEGFSPAKALGVGVTFTGVLVTVAGGSGGGEQSYWGNFLSLASAVLYAAYTTVLRANLPGDAETSTVGLLGYVGLICAVLSAPVALGLVGEADWASTAVSGRTAGYIVLKGLLDNLLSGFLWARAVLLTSPTVATCGLSVQVPISIVTDAIIGRAAWLRARAPATLMLGGGALVLIGFTGVALESADAADAAAGEGVVPAWTGAEETGEAGDEGGAGGAEMVPLRGGADADARDDIEPAAGGARPGQQQPPLPLPLLLEQHWGAAGGGGGGGALSPRSGRSARSGAAHAGPGAS